MKLPIIFRKALEQMGIYSKPVPVKGHHRHTSHGSEFVRPHMAVRKTKVDGRDAFMEWFGRSVVVSEDGTPKVVYHGTHTDFQVFNRMQKADERTGLKLDTVGLWFQTDADSARQYGPKVVSAYLSIKHPLIFTGDEKQGAFKAMRRAVEMEGGVESFRANAKAEGHDGILLVNDRLDKLDGDVWIAFEPNQIKSATDNAGTFNPHHPDITKGIHGGGHPLDYKTTFQGLDISIENRVGSIRRWKNRNGDSGQIKMKHAYGYIRRTQGVDGDHVDCFIGPNPDATHAYVIHAMAVPDFKKYDEDKCMLGFDSAEEAKRAFLDNYSDPRFFGSLHSIPMDKFIRKVLATQKHPQMIKSRRINRDRG